MPGDTVEIRDAGLQLVACLYRENLQPGQDAANARLIEAAPDHALICWAMCVQDATWEEWGSGNEGEFCFAGLRYVTSRDEFGAPVLTPALRAALAKARGQQ